MRSQNWEAYIEWSIALTIRRYPVITDDVEPSWFDVRPASNIVAQHQTNIGWTSTVSSDNNEIGPNTSWTISYVYTVLGDIKMLNTYYDTFRII